MKIPRQGINGNRKKGLIPYGESPSACINVSIDIDSLRENRYKPTTVSIDIDSLRETRC